MLKLLLDEHISPDVAEGLRRRAPNLMIRSMTEWEDGNFLGQEDSVCLEEAFVHGLTLVTYDRRTIPPLLKRWAEEVRPHAGIIFVDEKTISPADIGGLIKALAILVKQTRAWDWTNRIVFLRRQDEGRRDSKR
ncbi:MAG TPA: DUF5615 family PIN-like protein [Terracidiphilus sp.]|nr:DUF5615 family PIN-like protein [Terracidiphilus sp.]